MPIRRPVRHPVFVLILIMCLASLPAWCQANRELQEQIKSAFKGKNGLLRNFYSGSDLHYDQNGVLQDGEATQGPWTLAGVEITGVKITTQGVEIAGNRLGILYTDGKSSFVKLGKLKIHLEKTISSVDTLADIDQIIGKILIKQEDLSPVVPVYWRSYLTGTDSKSRSAAYQASLRENEIPTSKVATAATTDARATKVTPPDRLRSRDPQYNSEAASQHIEGVAVLNAVIDVTGAPTHISILRPVGMGLDEQAVQAVEQWKFRPATRNGEPVSVLVTIEVPFRCCP